MEAVERDVMDRKPKPKNEGIFAHGFGLRVVLQGALFALLTLIGFKVGESVTGTLAGGQTMAFAVLALSQITQAFNMRSEHSLRQIGFFGNSKLNLAALVSLSLVLAVLFTPLGVLFKITLLPWYLYLVALGLVFVPLPVMEISKLIRRAAEKRK
jgi:Ca2+-transporting ATPase